MRLSRLEESDEEAFLKRGSIGESVLHHLLRIELPVLLRWGSE